MNPRILHVMTALGTLLPVSLLADSLFLENTEGNPGTTVDSRLRLLNERKIVGVQLDLKIPPAQAVAEDAFALEGMELHSIRTKVDGNKMRVLVYSTSNAEIPSGGMLTIPLDLSANCPEGGPTLKIENLIFTNATGQNIPGVVFYHPLEVWRQGNFSEQQREDPETIGDLRDPDGDGFSNIMEFLFATNPLAPDSPSTAASGLTRRPVLGSDGKPVPGPIVFSFDFPKARGAEGVDLWVESSPDLKTWTRESALPIKVGAVDSVTDQMRLVLESNPQTVRRKFFRVGAARVATEAMQPGSVPKITFSEWAARYFTPAELANPPLAGEQADADGDSIVNLLEYLLGSDPRAVSKEALPTTGLVLDEGIQTVQLKYGVSREAKDAYLLIEVSPDLASWAPIGFSTTPTGRASVNAVEMGAKIEGEAPRKQFFRFKVSDTP